MDLFPRLFSLDKYCPSLYSRIACIALHKFKECYHFTHVETACQCQSKLIRNHTFYTATVCSKEIRACHTVINGELSHLCSHLKH